MGSTHAVWSVATSQHASHSLCKHAPLQSITPLWPRPLAKQDQQQEQHKELADVIWKPQLRQVDYKCSQDSTVRWSEQQSSRKRLRVRRPQAAAILGICGDNCTRQLHQNAHYAPSPTTVRRPGDSLADLEQLGDNELPQWQVVTCSGQGLPAAAWSTTHIRGGGFADDASAADTQQPPASASSSGEQRSKGAAHQRCQAAAQPAALNELMLAAKGKRPVTAAGIRQIMYQVQLSMPQLPLYQLAYAAWAAAQLSHQEAPSKRWLQQLLASAEQHFQQPSSVIDEAAVATLLQALVAMDQLPGQHWLAGCCAGLALEKWCSPRALSTLAACLPQLGYVPSTEFCSMFYEASAGCLSAFPAISAARMLHGVVAWQSLQYPQQQHPVPESWLLQVLQHLYAHSSQLKAPEIAMVLQALQRLQTAYDSHQQGVDQLLPAPGQQPATPLQLSSQQLLHALLGAVMHQLPRFKSQDMTVMLLSVASLSQQQPTGSTPPGLQHQPLVQWCWLQRVLTAVQLQHLDPRGQATCLTAAVMLIKGHLRLQAQQQQQQPAEQHIDQQHTLKHLQQQQTEPAMVKPLQRWIQLQQQQPQQQPQQRCQHASGTQTATGPLAAGLDPLSKRPPALDTGCEDVMGHWQQWLGSFFQHTLDQLLFFSCEDMTVSLCALASIKQVPPVEWYEAMLNAVQQQVPFMSPRQVAGVAWALGTMALLPSQHDQAVSLVPAKPWLRLLYPAVTDAGKASTVAHVAAASSLESVCMSRCSAPEVIRLMWSAGVCDFEPEVAWWTAAESQLLRSAAVGREAVPGLSRSQQQLSVQLLCQLAQAYAAAGRMMPASVLQQLITSPAVLQQLLLPGPTSSITALLQALRQCQCSLPAGWLQQLAQGLQQRFMRLESKELLQLLDSLAGAGLRLEHNQATAEADQHGTPHDSEPTPGAAATVLSWQASDENRWASTCLFATQLHMQHLSASDVSFLLWTFVKLQVKPPAAWLEAALQRLQTGFLDAKPSCLGLAITALSKLGFMPHADWMAGFMMATHRKTAAMAMDSNSNKQMLARFILMTLWALADMKVTPLNPKWLKLMLVTVHQQLPLLQPRYSLSLLQVLAQLRCRPTSRFLQNLLDHVGDCSRCSSADLVRVVYAAAALRWQPNQNWCHMFFSASPPKLAELDPKGLALVHWSLAVMRLTPPEAWKSAAISAVMLHLDDFNSSDLSMVLWSWGKMMVHLTLQQQFRRAQLGRQQRQWRQHVQQLFVEQQQQQEQPGWEQQWMQQQWHEWKQKQLHKQQMLQPLRTASAHSSRLQQRAMVIHKLLVAVSRLQGTFSLPNLVYLLVGVAKLQLRPSQEWLQGMVLHGSTEKLSVLNGLQLQQLLWALARLGFRAPRQWLDTASVLLEVSWQESDYIRHSAAAAFARLQQLALPGPGESKHHD